MNDGTPNRVYYLDEGVAKAIERVPLAAFEENVECDGVAEEVKEVRCEEFQDGAKDLRGWTNAVCNKSTYIAWHLVSREIL